MRRLLDMLDLSADAGTPAFSTEDVERRLIAGGCWLIAAAVAFQSVAHLADHLVFDLSSDFFNAGRDGGLFTFASAVATVICGIVALVLVAVWPRRAVLLVGLSVLLCYLALDDMYAGHERVAEKLDIDFLGIEDMGRVLWPLVFLPLLGACFAGLLAVASALSAPARRLVHGGLALLVLAVALEMASILLVNVGLYRPSTIYELEVTAEEGAELAGWLLIALGMTTMLLRGGPVARR